MMFSVSCSGKDEEKSSETDTVKDLVITDGSLSDSEDDTDENTAADPDHSSAETAPPSLDDLLPLIEPELSTVTSQGGSVSVYVEDLSDHSALTVDSRPMQAASLIKLYIAGSVYEQYEPIIQQDAYPGETDALLHSMITVSDNNAANTLLNKLGSGDSYTGMETVNQYCTAHGFSDTHLGRLLLAPNDTDDNYTSVNDCGAFLRAVQEGQLAGAGSILELMKQQERTEKLPAGVPSGVITANKTGELSDVENDAAVIYPQNKAYTVCVMTEGLNDTYSARCMITNLSAIIYNYMCSRE